MSTPWELYHSQPVSFGNWIEIAPRPRFHFLKQNLCILTPLKKEESLIHIVNCASLHRAPVEQRCNCPCWMDMIKSSEFSRSGPFQAHRSRYKLPALQILMLQEYPADCPLAKEGGIWLWTRWAYIQSLNVQYSVAVDLWHDQSPGKFPDNLLVGVLSWKSNGHRQHPGNLHMPGSLHMFSFFAHHIDTQDFRWRDKYEMLKVQSRKLKAQSILVLAKYYLWVLLENRKLWGMFWNQSCTGSDDWVEDFIQEIFLLLLYWLYIVL